MKTVSKVEANLDPMATIMRWREPATFHIDVLAGADAPSVNALRQRNGRARPASPGLDPLLLQLVARGRRVARR